MRWQTAGKFQLRKLVLLVSIFLVFVTCKTSYDDPDPRPLPDTVPGLIEFIEDEKEAVPAPKDAIEALGDFGPEAAPAIPVITPWLNYRADRGYTNSLAAEVLAKMGPAAAPAVPELVAGISWLEGTESLELQFALSSFIIALGHIGPDAAASVPVLIELHYSYPNDKWFEPAWSIAQIIEQDWPDANVKFEWDHGAPILPFDQVLQEDLYGENYLITLAAIEWWENEGQYQSWPPLDG